MLCDHHLYLVPKCSHHPEIKPNAHEAGLPRLCFTAAPSICILFVWSYLFWMFLLSKIRQRVTFCVWLLSLSVMFSRSSTLQGPSERRSFLRLGNISLWIYRSLSVDGRLGCSALGLLWMVLLWTFVYEDLFDCPFSISLDVYLGMALHDIWKYCISVNIPHALLCFLHKE